MNTNSANTPALKLFRSLYISHAPKLIFYACKYVDYDTAEDLVQDVFLRVWQKELFLTGEEGLRTYLFRAVQNACLDFLKHQEVEDNYIAAVTTQLKLEELDRDTLDSTLFAEDNRLLSVYREINRLPEKCREVFTLAYLGEKKTHEIASLLDISPRTVEAQLYKALKIIRNALLIIALLLSFTVFPS